MEIKVCTSDENFRLDKVSELFVYENFTKVPAEMVEAGDICVVCGINDVLIGETLVDKFDGLALPRIKIEEPSVNLAFSINTSPFVGHEGKHVTSKKITERLYHELERNLAMKVEDGGQ
ncbi:hypothetical protein SUGI_1155340 [Cryptomeria japonica]|nr:hypothetical protein SUGI_1155340 [Cryptomeria japonica]